MEKEIHRYGYSAGILHYKFYGANSLLFLFMQQKRFECWWSIHLERVELPITNLGFNIHFPLSTESKQKSVQCDSGLLYYSVSKLP